MEKETLDEVLKAFRMVAQEFKGKGDEDVVAMAEFYADFISKKRFGKFYTRALALLIAHEYALSGIAAAYGSSGAALSGGAVRMEKEGDLQREYQVEGQEQSLYTKTVYGRKFMDLKKMCIVPVVTRYG